MITENNELILRPEEVLQRRRESAVKKIQEVAIQEEQAIQNTAGLVKIEYESQGRFSTPSILYFDDFTPKHINDIELSNQDNLLETLLSILNDIKKHNNDFDVKDMTAEDLLETLIAIKQQFEGNTHIHYWMCDCQMDKSEKDRIINEYILELSDLQFRSMTDVDVEMKEYMAEVFKTLTDEQFKEYLYKKYKNNPLEDVDGHTREMEISSIVVKEPFNIISGEDVYTIRYPRLEDVIKAKKYAEKIYNPKLKNVQNRKEHGVPLHELKSKKEDEINRLKEEQGKELVLYAKSMMLQTKNGQVLSDAEKYEEFKNNVKRKTMRNIENLFEIIQFGLSTETELTCPICGESETRLLRDVFDPRQLLPLHYKQSSNGNASKRELGLNTGSDFYFSI